MTEEELGRLMLAEARTMPRLRHDGYGGGRHNGPGNIGKKQADLLRILVAAGGSVKMRQARIITNFGSVHEFRQMLGRLADRNVIAVTWHDRKNCTVVITETGRDLLSYADERDPPSKMGRPGVSVSIGGIKYNSISDAVKSTGMSCKTVRTISERQRGLR